ncbi:MULTISPECIES: nuclear transport factor 2 family protein [Pseudoalteromonas]|uniref:SnoaL-like domain-containing protein n=1 Tax=Pseudoalteromonas fuliginea TaxID=1872678 RepID=A0AB73BD41_9GAMM|nr:MULTISPECIES: nuclear transport factor 2 family protein [Pseudoalteromonas]KAA1157505.1 hypothetical protein EU508_17425 [Pseudoalteromonas fuliginea]KDC55768.1 hypothetical protein DO88_01805 [Pseudoalteromonas sp. S3431]
MKPLSIILASLITTVALISYASDQQPEVTEPKLKSAEQVVTNKGDSVSKNTNTDNFATEIETNDKINTLEYKAPELKKPVIDTAKTDDSKVFGNEAPQPVEKPKNKVEKAVAVAEAEKAVTQAKEALTTKQQTKAKQSRESLAVVEQLVNAYNARNIEEFIRVYSEDVEFYIFPNELLFKGKEKLIARYGLMFKKLKCIHSSPIKRIVHGDIVIDHELSETCSTDKNVVDKRSELISSYQIKDGKIIRVLFFR